MRTFVRSVALSILLAAIAGPAIAGTTVDTVKGTSKFEAYGAATNDGVRNLFGWTESTGSAKFPFAAFVRPGHDRINARKTNGFMGGFDDNTDTLIFQQSRGRESDVFLYDVDEQRRRGLPAINNGAWQWGPSIDSGGGGVWILYGENKFSSPSAKWKLFLYNRTTGVRMLLDETTNRCRCIFPGNVSYPYVTWTKKVMGTAWVYNIGTQTKEAVELPANRDEYQSAVTEDGTAYVAQAGDRCGTNARLYRVDPDGTPTRLLNIKDGREPISISVDESSLGVDLYFDRFVCRSQTSDILRINDADTVAGPIAEPAMTAADRGARGARMAAAMPTT
jgi:hypothetical protein